MAVLSEMIERIAKRLVDDSHTAVDEDDIILSINDAIKFYKVKRFWFNVPSIDILIEEGDTSIALPTDFLADLPRNTLVINDQSDNWEVRKKQPAIYTALSSDTGTGRPRIYTIVNGVMMIYDTADRQYSAKLTYIQDFEELLDPDDENLFTQQAESLIRNDALSRLHAELRQDDKMAAVFQARANSEYKSLLSRTNKLNKTGVLTVQQ